MNIHERKGKRKSLNTSGKYLFLFRCFTPQSTATVIGHVGMVSSPNLTFFLGKLDQYFMHTLLLVNDKNPS